MKSKKFPSFSQWKQIFKILKGFEKKFFLVLATLTVLSGVYLAVSFYINNTKEVPGYGGTYTEGIVGQPRYINPIYGETNDVDRTLIDLIYSGLMTYDKNGKLINDLVDNYQISESGRTYKFQLKKDLYWQDGIPLTSDDVIYTIKTIQNSDYKSPLRANWLDVEAEKISDSSFTLSLNTPYNSFLENCTLKIIPQHIWKNVLPENFSLSPYNLQPVGSGLYSLSNIDENSSNFITSIVLKANNKYYGKVPYISKIELNFFSTKDELIKAANKKSIDGFDISSLDYDETTAEQEIKQGWAESEKFNTYSFSMPRYFAVFFNSDNAKIFADKNITQGLNYAVDKKELSQKISETYKQKNSVVDSPILPDYFGYLSSTTSYDFNTDTANKLLDKSGYKDSGSGQREKANTKTPAFQFKNYLKVGSSGSEVTELQGCLSRLDDSFKNILQTETNGKYTTITESAVTAFQQKYLPDTKATGETGPGTRTKLNQLCFASQNNSLPLKFTLTTINQPQLVYVANLLKDYWQKIGVTVEIKVVELSDLKDTIKNRDYDALLYGQALGSLPDLYPFWHSTQVRDPGLNLAQYESKKADQLLKDARESLDENVKIQKYESLQNIILADNPAIFLYNPDYIYWVSQKVKGIDTTKIVDPAKRFENISNWYVKTRRVWK
jgi:ABC-type transport system substrate-binding protein